MPKENLFLFTYQIFKDVNNDERNSISFSSGKIISIVVKMTVCTNNWIDFKLKKLLGAYM